MGQTLFDKLWDRHVVAELGGGVSLLHIDRHIMHDLGSPRSFKVMRQRGLPVRNPELTFITPDHAISSQPGHREDEGAVGTRLLQESRRAAVEYGVKLFDLGQEGHGIVHVVGPELGLSLPGLSIVCGDSHTCTHGGLGALAFGIGSSEMLHVLATQTLVQRKPRRMRITLEGDLAPGVSAKDVILHLIGRLGTDAGTDYAVEYAGSAVRAMPVEARLTLCNLSIELGAKVGLIAPDDTTFDYLRGRPYAPKGAMWDRAVADWRSLATDPDARFDCEHTISMAEVAPQITWGTSPQDVIGIDERIPEPARQADAEKRAAAAAALDYMGLAGGERIEGAPIDWVFIGSCANSRLSDLREAARVARGRKVAPGVTAWVVPGSEIVKRQAEAEGLHKDLIAAGFEWREPGCSMCVAANGERVPPKARVVSTSNRNFVGRQGPLARTHLASPAMAAAAAVTGAICDVRKLGEAGA